MSGNISINSEELVEAVNVIDEGLSLLQSNMLPSINSDFQALIDTGLFSGGISKLSSQIQSISTSSSNLITKFMTHTNEFEELEEEISNLANNYSSNYGASNGGSGGSSHYVSDSNIGNVNQGQSVNNGNLVTEISNLDDTTQLNLINFLNINKDDDTSLQSLLFDSNKAGVLLTLLKKFYKDMDTSQVSVDDASSIQRTLLKLIGSNETLMLQISENTILTEKKYFESVAKTNNVSFEEFVLNDKYSDLLLESVRDAYDGNIGENVDSSTVSSIRNVVDAVAESNGISSEEVITNASCLSMLLKG